MSDSSILENGSKPRLLLLGNRRYPLLTTILTCIEVGNRRYSEWYSIKCSRTRPFSSNQPPKSQRTISSIWPLIYASIICLCSSFIDFQVWDFPGQIDFFEPTFALDAIFGEMGALIFVVDAQVLTSSLRCLVCID